MPDMLTVHAAAGFGGHGTLCGALAEASVIINMVTYGEKRDEYLQSSATVDRLFWWYAEQDFPTEQFDDLAPLPKQITVKAMSPLCHASVSRWSLEAGEVVYIVTTALNEFFDGKWAAPVWNPSREIEHCIGCHGPGTPTTKPRRWNQQGHMDCLMCHEDHTT
jgi:hypothetical protein